MSKQLTDEERLLVFIRGLVASLPPEEQAKVLGCADKLREIAAASGEHGLVAIALIGAELSAKD